MKFSVILIPLVFRLPVYCENKKANFEKKETKETKTLHTPNNFSFITYSIKIILNVNFVKQI